MFEIGGVAYKLIKLSFNFLETSKRRFITYAQSIKSTI